MFKFILYSLSICVVSNLFSKEPVVEKVSDVSGGVAKESFVIETPRPSRRASKNDLRQSIGDELKRALESSTALIDELGKIQCRIASLQRHIVARVSSLVENDRSFRKAGKKSLRDALQTMTTINKKLRRQKDSINIMLVQMNKNSCLKEIRG